MQQDEFLNEVQAFHNPLMGDMGKRIGIVNYWSRTDIHVDFEH